MCQSCAHNFCCPKWLKTSVTAGLSTLKLDMGKGFIFLSPLWDNIYCGVQFITDQEKALSRFWFTARLQLLYQPCNLSPDQYTPHSFHIRAATSTSSALPSLGLKSNGTLVVRSLSTIYSFGHNLCSSKNNEVLAANLSSTAVTFSIVCLKKSNC